MSFLPIVPFLLLFSAKLKIILYAHVLKLGGQQKDKVARQWEGLASGTRVCAHRLHSLLLLDRLKTLRAAKGTGCKAAKGPCKQHWRRMPRPGTLGTQFGPYNSSCTKIIKARWVDWCQLGPQKPPACWGCSCSVCWRSCHCRFSLITQMVKLSFNRTG